jgi:hypothetical protein
MFRLKEKENKVMSNEVINMSAIESTRLRIVYICNCPYCGTEFYTQDNTTSNIECSDCHKIFKMISY